ncbi:hypothetical protein V5F79_22440 [Xanthobacter flavus]|uniref:hypothetical protein n=1 Tax=Xanthobacter flavus TaxID=281 RepID=UPI0037261B38
MPASDDLVARLRYENGDCPFCGRDPYHYVDNGVGCERVAVVCCDLGIALLQHGDEQLIAQITLRAEAADEIERLNAALASRDKEIKRMEKLVYVPGLWKCPKCKFSLVQANLNARDGSVTARDQPGDRCPNCASPLWRVSERDAGNEMVDRAEEYLSRATAAEALAATAARERDEARAECERLCDVLDHATELLVDTWHVAMSGDPEDEIAVQEARAALHLEGDEHGGA